MTSRHLILLLVALAALGCGGDSSSMTATGGMMMSTTGGASLTGGSSATGGDSTTGGSVQTGGTTNTGGTKATGGMGNTGGSNTGGMGSTGGVSSTGGDAGPSPIITDCTDEMVSSRQCPACDDTSTCDAPTYTDNQDGTVTSSCCGLTWQQATSPMDLTWAEAYAYCESLDLVGGGWRLPTVGELQTLVVDGSGPTIDATFFPDTQAYDYWTISSDQDFGWLWAITFFDGSALGADSANTNPVRCVRP